MDLAQLTTLRVGGPARDVVAPESEAELVAVVRGLDASGEPVLVVGGGSNLLVADAGFPGTVVQVRPRGVRAVAVLDDVVELEVAAGESWDGLVRQVVDEGLSGVEAMSGIPGLTGATPVQNVGAYGQELSDTLRRVRLLDRTDGSVRTLATAELGLGYRTSRLKHDERYLVLAVVLGLTRTTIARPGAPVRYAELARALGVPLGAAPDATEQRTAVLALRAAKGMVLDPADPDTWSAGSFFTNPLLDPAQATALPADAPRFAQPDGRVKTSAAWLIERAGFARGYGLPGPAALSTKHVLALTNRGGATAADLVALATEVRDAVVARFGVALEPEPRLVGCGLPPPAA